MVWYYHVGGPESYSCYFGCTDLNYSVKVNSVQSTNKCFFLVYNPAKDIELKYSLYEIPSAPPLRDSDLFLLSTSFHFPPAAKYLELRFNRVTRLLGTVLFIVQTVSKTPVKL